MDSHNNCGARTHACRVETHLDTVLRGLEARAALRFARVRQRGAGTSAGAARTSACATVAGKE